MKIGLLSYQNANNFGASLQAYALSEFLTKNNISNEYINYTCEFVEKRYRKKINKRNIKTIIINYMNRAKNKKFDNFRKNNIPLSKIIYDKSNITKVNEFYDIFLVGSDQVWNYDLNGSDYVYLLNFVDKNKLKLSYASSLGLERINENHILEYKKFLSEFNYLSVRENSAKKILNNLGIENVDTVVDPCLLHDSSFWKCKAKTIKDTNFVLVYLFDANNLGKFNKKFPDVLKNETIYKISGGISIKDIVSKNIKIKYAIDPFDFIAYINNANLVITDSFHATLFSIVLKKPFVTFFRNRPGKDARISELLKISNLESREFDNLEIKDLYSNINVNIENSFFENICNDSRKKLIDKLKGLQNG